MCPLCASFSGGQVLAGRSQVLQLLALLERQDALPADLALHLAQKVLVLAAQVDGSAFRCESVLPPQAATVDTNEGRLF